MQVFNIYEAGGMGKFGKDNFDLGNKWRVYIKKQLEQVYCDYKVKVVNPNDYYNFLDDSTYDSDREVMNLDLSKLRKSNLIICNFNDPYSIGTQTELGIGFDRNIPVLGLCEHGEEKILHPWQKCICEKIFTNIDDLICYVIDYYLN